MYEKSGLDKQAPKLDKKKGFEAGAQCQVLKVGTHGSKHWFSLTSLNPGQSESISHARAVSQVHHAAVPARGNQRKALLPESCGAAAATPRPGKRNSQSTDHPSTLFLTSGFNRGSQTASDSRGELVKHADPGHAPQWLGRKG